MKLITILIFLLISNSVFPQKNNAIFLHHSVGGQLYNQGNVASWVKTYNSVHGTDFQITPRTFPDVPYPWVNYPYDYWNLWVNNNCDNSNPNIECLASIASKCGLVIFKHCFPGASIGPDTGKPDITSSRQTLENYKLQYRALRTLMDGMPDKKFMVWTLIPLHRLETTTDEATRAHEFVEWVKNDWLTEDGKKHPNIFIFDYYSLTAELNANPVNGKQYCLKYEYEASHTEIGSHPNSLDYQTIGPIFAQAVVNVLAKNYYVANISVSTQSGENAISTYHGTLQMQASILPDDAKLKSVTWSVTNLTGKASVDSLGLLTAEENGTVKVVATAKDSSGVTGELQISISNQKILVEQIQIIDNLGNDTIKGINTSINLQSSVIPANATNPAVEWLIENISGKASIDGNGVLVTSAPGTVKVIARATDESKISGQKEYQIIIPDGTPKGISSNQVRIYPNPAKDKIGVQLDNLPPDGATVEIRNAAGQLVLKKRVFETMTEFSLINYPGGIYFVTVSGNKSSSTHKIVNSKLFE